jgi:hypothetical protein
MREYMQIGLQYSIESLSVMDKKERQKKKMREMFTASQSKNQPLREREREEEEKTREGKKKKEDSRRKQCVYISLLPLVHNIPLSLTIKQQYQISSLATFLENQVSIRFYLDNIIYIIIQSFIIAESCSKSN